MANEYVLPFTAEEIAEKLLQIDRKLDANVLEFAVESALDKAKSSGEFDGNTPVKGVDYWTEDDKQGIVNDVLAALPVYDGKVVSV